MMTNKILVLFLLGAALPTICMDVKPENAAPEVQVLDDGQEWLSIKNMGHLVPLLKKVVACRSEAISQYHLNLYTMDANNPTHYGFFCDRSLHLLCRRANLSVSRIMSDDRLQNAHWFMRLLTYDEMHRMTVDAASGALQFYPLNFTLDNLMLQERIKYCRAQAIKQSWPWQRELLIGHKDPASPLHVLPKDMIRALRPYVLHAQAYELLDYWTKQKTCSE